MKEKRIWQAIRILSVIGIILAIYLFYSFLSPNPPDVCNISKSVNCDAVTKGALALFLGIPVSLVGLLGYTVILIASLFKRKNLTLAMTTFGLVFCLRISFLEIFSLAVLCPVCLACQLVMVVVFVLSLILKFGKTAPVTPTAEPAKPQK